MEIIINSNGIAIIASPKPKVERKNVEINIIPMISGIAISGSI